MLNLFGIISISFLLLNCSSTHRGRSSSMDKLTEVNLELAMVTESLAIINKRLVKIPDDRTLSMIKSDLVEQKKSLESRKKYYQRKI